MTGIKLANDPVVPLGIGTPADLISQPFFAIRNEAAMLRCWLHAAEQQRMEAEACGRQINPAGPRQRFEPRHREVPA